MKDIMDRHEYHRLLKEEAKEWKIIEEQNNKNGTPWWTDLRRAKMPGKNLHWGADPKKERVVRGHERDLIIKYAKKSGNRVLDIGCGSGWLSLELARAGMDVTGIDASADRIALAKKFLKENPYKKGFGSVKYLVGDLNQIDFPANSFDAIVVWDTLHHFPFLDDIIAKANRWLRPGGSFITYDHLGHWLLKLAGKVQRAIKKPSGKIMPYEDLLGAKMIKILRKYFSVGTFYTRLSFPVSASLNLFFGQDSLFSLLPVLIKVDKLLCNSHLFTGEYFFFYGKKTKNNCR